MIVTLANTATTLVLQYNRYINLIKFPLHLVKILDLTTKKFNTFKILPGGFSVDIGFGVCWDVNMLLKILFIC